MQPYRPAPIGGFIQTVHRITWEKVVDLPGEKWVEANGFKDYYEVSSLGRVRTYTVRVVNGKLFRRSEPRLIKPSVDRQGYRRVSLLKDGKVHYWRVARLMLVSFVGPMDGMVTGHLNGNNADDRIDNLRWVTPKENADHRTLHGRTIRGEKMWAAVLTEKDVREIKLGLASGAQQKVLADRFGVHPNTIYWINRGRIWKHVAI